MVRSAGLSKMKNSLYNDVLHLKMCGSRKYPSPHHGGNWKFQRGEGGSKAQEIPEGWGVDS